MTEKEWEEKYRPVKNHLVANAPRRGDMFETFGEELEFVRQQNYRHIWTWIDDEGDWIVSGLHLVNRIGYFITEEPWQDGELIQVAMD